MADENIKLGLDLGPTAKTAADAAKAMDALKTSTKSTADTFEVLESGLGVAEREMDRLTKEAVQATQAQKAMNQILRETETQMIATSAAGIRVSGATEEVKNKMAGFGQTALQSGRFLQDFAQGGVGGVLNNIEGLAQALGGGPGLAGVMTVVGLAAFFAMPKLKEFFGAIEEGFDYTKEHRDDLDKTRAAVAAINASSEDRIRKMDREKDALEATISKQKELNAELQKFRNLKEPEEEKMEKARVEALAKQFGKPAERAALVGEVAMGMVPPEQLMEREESRQKIQEELKITQAAMRGGKFPNIRRQLRERIEVLRGRLGALDAQSQRERDQAEEMVSGAAIGGREVDLQRVLARIPEESRFRRGLAGQTREEMVRNRQLNAEASIRADQDKTDMDAAKEEGQQADKDTAERLKQNQREQQRIEAGDRRNRQVDAIKQHDAAQMRHAEAAGMGAEAFAMQTGQFATPEQASQIADQALKNMGQGMNMQAATWQAVMQKIQAIKHATEQGNAMWGQMQVNSMPPGGG